MTLTLKIRNMDRLDNGMPAEFVLSRRGGMIGRAATCDWSLPDPRHYISSRHCEVTFRDGAYTVADVSTNGTFLNGNPDRMAEPRRVEPGDLFLVGHYEIVAELSGEAVAAIERREQQAAAAAEQQAGWSWDAHGAGPAAAPASRGGDWNAASANSGLSSGFGSAAAPLGDGGSGAGEWGTPAPVASDWAEPAVPAATQDSGWGGAAASAEGWAAAPAAPAPGGGWAPPVSGPTLGRDQPYAQRGAAPPPSAPPASDSLGSNAWAPAAAAPPPPSPSVWDGAREPVPQASAWSSAVAGRPREATPNDIWGSMESSNVVDWARADFGGKPAAKADPLGLTPKPASDALPPTRPIGPPAAPAPTSDAGWGEPAGTPSAGGWGDAPIADGGAGDWSAPATNEPAPSAPVAVPRSTTPDPPRPAPAPAAPQPAATAGPDLTQIVFALAAAAGLKPEQVKQPGPATIERAGDLLRRLTAGLVVMVEARARAKSQMGAEQTGLEFDGNNPLKFARTTDQALAQLLNPPERGFMPAERAIEDAYFDLQSHQMATLKAMQGALRATLDRFSPAAIKKRAESGGLLARLLPGGREATLWQTYEREFSGVAQGSDEAFMDVFAKEFRNAYDEQSRNRKKS